MTTRNPQPTPVSAAVPSPMHWKAWLSEARQNFGATPRDLGREIEQHLLVNPPWITKLYITDPLARLVQNSTLRNVFRNGQIVWGHVIQANSELYSPPPSVDSYTYDRPGEVVFANDNEGKVDPTILKLIAHRLASLAETNGLDAELRSWAKYLKSETTRVVGKPVPKQLSPTISCFGSTTLFRRGHLPGGVLHRPMVPLVIAPQSPFFAMTLPYHFWPKSFLAWWTNG